LSALNIHLVGFFLVAELKMMFLTQSSEPNSNKKENNPYHMSFSGIFQN